MPNTPMTNRTGNVIVRLVIIALAVQLALIGYVAIQSYDQRTQIVNAARTACEDNKVDRKADASGWRIAEKARRAEGQIGVADQYKLIAEGLESRGLIDCTQVFPSASILP